MMSRKEVGPINSRRMGNNRRKKECSLYCLFRQEAELFECDKYLLSINLFSPVFMHQHWLLVLIHGSNRDLTCENVRHKLQRRDA